MTGTCSRADGLGNGVGGVEAPYGPDTGAVLQGGNLYSY